jgi:hypothetical protein
MRASTAYFAGAGTIIAAIAAGVGGGLLVGDIISPKSPKQSTEMSRLERRMSAEPIPAAATPSEPGPYLSAPQPSQPSTSVAAAPAPVQAQTETANASPPAQPADPPAAKQPEIKKPETPSSQSASQPAPPAAQPVARGQTTAPNDALAKARDADIKRAEDRRKAERRQQWAERQQQWAERRRQRQQQELQAVEEKVREDTEPRRDFVGDPVRVEMPRIRLFGPD